jgi:predicted nuclease with TOPRIM domain
MEPASLKGSIRLHDFTLSGNEAQRQIKGRDGRVYNMMIKFAEGTSKEEINRELQRYDGALIGKIAEFSDALKLGEQRAASPKHSERTLKELRLHSDKGGDLLVEKVYQGNEEKIAKFNREKYEKGDKATSKKGAAYKQLQTIWKGVHSEGARQQELPRGAPLPLRGENGNKAPLVAGSSVKEKQESSPAQEKMATSSTTTTTTTTSKEAAQAPTELPTLQPTAPTEGSPAATVVVQQAAHPLATQQPPSLESLNLDSLKIHLEENEKSRKRDLKILKSTKGAIAKIEQQLTPVIVQLEEKRRGLENCEERIKKELNPSHKLIIEGFRTEFVREIADLERQSAELQEKLWECRHTKSALSGRLEASDRKNNVLRTNLERRKELKEIFIKQRQRVEGRRDELRTSLQQNFKQKAQLDKELGGALGSAPESVDKILEGIEASNALISHCEQQIQVAEVFWGWLESASKSYRSGEQKDVELLKAQIELFNARVKLADTIPDQGNAVLERLADLQEMSAKEYLEKHTLPTNHQKLQGLEKFLGKSPCATKEEFVTEWLPVYAAMPYEEVIIASHLAAYYDERVEAAKGEGEVDNDGKGKDPEQ